MYQVSNEYKTDIKKPLRNNGYIDVEIKDAINLDYIQNYADIYGDDLTYWSLDP